MLWFACKLLPQYRVLQKIDNSFIIMTLLFFITYSYLVVTWMKHLKQRTKKTKQNKNKNKNKISQIVRDCQQVADVDIKKPG